jgi:hypothetical protein
MVPQELLTHSRWEPELPQAPPTKKQESFPAPESTWQVFEEESQPMWVWLGEARTIMRGKSRVWLTPAFVPITCMV